jgi:uncharacterized lipoprotein YmbA
MRDPGILRYAAIGLFIFTASGCLSVPSTPNPRFYMLNSIGKEQAVEKLEIAPGSIIEVGPIGIPDYQDRPQIVTKNNDGTLSFAQLDRWGEPLDSGLARIISSNLAAMLPEVNLETYPCNFAIPLDYQVIANVVQLDSQLQKEMIFTVQWSIINAKNRKMVLTKRSQFIEPVNPPNYFGLSQALSSACVSLSREIAGELSKLPKPLKPVREKPYKK